MKRNTREIIVDKALEIFNERGSHSVTTNHIAEACRMSPGNLYYHFKNKEEIIREIFGRILTEFAECWSPADFDSEQVPPLLQKVRRMGSIYYHYRFFYLELPSLLGQDSELAKHYHENEKLKHGIIRNVIHRMMEHKLVRANIDISQTESIVSSSWILTDFWLSYLYISGEEISPESVMRGMDNYMSFIMPYLSVKGLKLFKDQAQQQG